MGSSAAGARRLRDAAAAGQLDDLCRRHGIRVLTIFGSAGRGEAAPRDLDVGVITEPGVDFRPLDLLEELGQVADTDSIDLAHLNRGGPVLRERALVATIGLYESQPGALADAQVAAIGERIDTDPMRRLDLNLLTG